MDRILNVSDKSNVAIHALALASGERGVTAALCASELGVSPSDLAKVLQELVHGGLLSSTRGAAAASTSSARPPGSAASMWSSSWKGRCPTGPAYSARRSAQRRVFVSHCASAPRRPC